MEPSSTPQLYRVWGEDKIFYGPLDLETLRSWVGAQRVNGRSWVLAEQSDQWQRAADIPELKPSLAAQSLAKPAAPHPGGFAKPRPGFTSANLRRIKLFESLEDAQLEAFAHYLEVVKCPQFGHIVRQGQRGDAMYLVLAGELRARTMVGERETILATFSAGDFFGDMSLFDHGPRSADVVANVDSMVLRISVAAFDRLTREAPALATPFLRATARTLSARIRADNKRLNQLTQQFNASRS